MNHRFTVPAVLLGAWLGVACNDASPVGPGRAGRLSSRVTTDPVAADAPGVTVLSWNVYVGAEIERVVQARTPDEAVALATEEWARVHATDFPARAGALAAAIAARRPHVVGLQELALYRITDRPFAELATQVAYDFLGLVVDSLHAQGLDYTVAAVDRTTDIQVPVIAGFEASGQPILSGVRFTDGDAVLVRSDVTWTNPRSGTYAAFTPVTLGDVATGVHQGWSSVDASVGGTTYRVVATHLAGQEVRDIQVAQGEELLGLLGAEARPTIVVGDFNSDAFGADSTRATPTYRLVQAAGFTDTWIAPERQAPGLTCCERADLLNPRNMFDQRLDFIFTRHLPDGARPVRRDVIGDRSGDRTAAGLWPSDHAGVVATFLAPGAGAR